MAKLTKKQKAFAAIDREKFYGVDEALGLVKQNATAKFDETVEVALNLGVDPRHADQMVRGVVNLPKGTGKSVRVAVFAKGGVKLGEGLSKVGDQAIIDGAIVNGSAGLVQRIAGGARRLQSGFLFHYAFAMILGLILLLGGYWLIGQ